jgi:phenylacetate-CoA ligase
MLDAQLARHGDRLAALLSFARENVPYYKRVIPPNVEALVSDSQNWQQVPLLGKQQIQADWPGFLSEPDVIDDPSVEILVTSGSTGTPLKIVRPRQELRVQTKRLWATRARWQPGIMGWKQLRLFSNIESLSQKALQFTVEMSLDLSWDALASYVGQVEAFEPDWMYGAPSAVYRWAQYYRRARQSIPTLKLIEVTGEQLLPHQQSLIEEAFGCPVVNHYGCREFWVLSYECPGRLMHAWDDDLLLEVVRDGRPVPPGETGELVVTSLTNRLMPLIRYKVEDIVQMAASNCSCGDLRPILAPVGGRAGSLVVTRHRAFATSLLNYVFSHFLLNHDQAFVEYQVVQSDYDLLEIYLVPGECFERNFIETELSKAINQFLPEVRCKFIVCSRITPLPSGKPQFFISCVDPNGPPPR